MLDENVEIYRECFASLVRDRSPTVFRDDNYISKIPGYYRVLIDQNYETEFCANNDDEAILKFKEYFRNK